MTPEGWQRRKIRDFSRRSREVNVAGLDLEPLSVTKDRGVILQSDKYNKRIATDSRKYQIAERGDFAFDPMSLYYGAIGRLDSIERGLISPDYVVFKADDSVHASFLERRLRFPEMHAVYESLSETGNVFGKRRRLYWSIFEEIDLELPPLAEQKKIAAILSSVDDAIEATHAVIDQLQVVKKAMMAELLTRGIPGRHRRFKMTEIGEVPEEWEVVTAQNVFESQPLNGRSPPSRSIPPGVPTFSIGAVRQGRVDVYAHLKYADVDPSVVHTVRLTVGDILIVRGNGNPDLVGRCGRVDAFPDGCIYPDILVRVRPDPRRVSNRFFLLIWNSDVVRSQIRDKAQTTNGTHKINSGDIRSIKVPLPSLEEQRAISEVLDSLADRTETEEANISALRALKSALLSVLLTGEVRVRPDEPAP